MRTHQYERAAAAVLIFGVAGLTAPVDGLVTSADWAHGLTAMAVFLGFGHMQIADRLAEAEERRTVRAVECHHKLVRYLVAKELVWVAAFVASGLWPALVGCALFLGYPVWRRIYRRYRPLGRTT